MSTYPDIEALKASIDSTVFSNTTRAVTGDILRDKIKDVVDTLSAQDATLSTLISLEVSRAIAAEQSLGARVSAWDADPTFAENEDHGSDATFEAIENA